MEGVEVINFSDLKKKDKSSKKTLKSKEKPVADPD